MEWTTIYIISAILILPVFIYSLISQVKVNSTFEEFSKNFAKSGITGAELAKRLLAKAEISNVEVVRINGHLSDCYDSHNKVVKLSSNVYDSTSIAALGVCAHEIGHAIQDSQKNIIFRIRRFIIPVTSFITRAFIPLILIGSILNFMFFIPTIGYYIILVSLVSYGCSLLIYFVTLPLEYDASKKALKLLAETQTLDEVELAGSKKVLTAAIHTYIAAFLSSLIYFLRFLSILMIFNRRD